MKNQIKTLLLALSLGLIIILSSCGSDDSGPAYEFIDQNLQGTIDGLPYVYGEGTVENSSFSEDEFSFDLYHTDEVFDDVCQVFGTELVKVVFNTPNETGIYELFFDFNNFDGLVVNLVNPSGEGGIPQNNLASMGAIEILTITDTEVTGRIDARLDAENTVNGNFSALLCAGN